MYSDALTETISRLIAQQPFYAAYLYNMMEIKEDASVPTAATDGSTIYVNTEYFGKLSPPEREFVLAHEITHGVYSHMLRGKGYRARGFGPDLKPWSDRKYNKAADYVINDLLTTTSVGKMPEGGLHNPRWTWDMLADDVYCELQDEEDDGQDNFDEHFEPAEGKAPTEDEVKSAVVQAKNAAKAMGKLPGQLERVLGELVEPSVSWREMLRAVLTANAGKDQATWSKPNRRRIATPPHIYYPGSTGFALGEIAIVIDTSGSVGQNELNQFMGELSSILDECRPEKCHVLWTDTQVAHVDEVTDAGELQYLKAHGGGGTDMEAAFRYMDDNNIFPETCVVLTDGYTSFNTNNEPTYDVIWGITTKDREAPYGRSIHVDIK